MKRLTLLLILMVGFTACQPKKDSVRANAAALGGSVAGFGLTGQCASGMSNIGAIFDSGQSSIYGNFESQVKSLLSATVLPEDIGSIAAGSNETTGVRFAGTLFLETSGQVVASKSKLAVTVYDSVWYQNSLTNPSEQGILLEFNPAKGATISGSFAPTTGQGFLLVKDQYGEIRFDGSYNAQYFSGTVTFKNTANVTGAQATSGSLGQFVINSCGIIKK